MLEPIDHILSAVENQPHWQEVREFRRLLEYWPEVVGVTVARHTRPYAAFQNVLHVATSSSTWAQELKFKRRTILKKLNLQLSTSLTDIRFSSAQWQEESTSESSSANHSFDFWQNSSEQITPSALTPTDSPEHLKSAFQDWAEAMQTKVQTLPVCPQCQCPTPTEELQRWHVCALCAAKQWRN
ncbi:MAG: DUF721 domain-containing protein [Coleofasciculaceae cyanobacterium]